MVGWAGGADAGKAAGTSKKAKARARKAAAKKAAGAGKPGAKKVTFAAPVAGAAVAGTDGVIKAHINCHKCGRKGHFSDHCPGT